MMEEKMLPLKKLSIKSLHESMFEVIFKRLNNLKRFGEMVVVTLKKTIQGKLSDRGTVVGYQQNHSEDFYCLFHVKTS
jgi:hypothetical protein